MSRIDSEVAHRILKARKELGFSQEEIGKQLGLTETAYGHYERGRTPFTIDMLFQLSRILGRSVEYFLGLTDPDNEAEKDLLAMFRSIDDPQLRKAALRAIRALAEE